MTKPISVGASVARISGFTATAIVVADMVGVGVFTSLGFQVKDITSGFSLLLLWIIGGIVAMCGAISYAELALMFPRSSGEYNFLRRIYHPAFGFMAGLVVGDRRVFRAGRARRHGIWRLFQVGDAGRADAFARACHRLARLAGASARHPKRQRVSQHLDRGQAPADRGVPGVRLRVREPPADLIRTERGRHWLHHQRAIRHQPRLRDVFLLGLERRDVHHRGDPRTPSAPSPAHSSSEP